MVFSRCTSYVKLRLGKLVRSLKNQLQFASSYLCLDVVTELVNVFKANNITNKSRKYLLILLKMYCPVTGIPGKTYSRKKALMCNGKLQCNNLTFLYLD